MDHIRARMQTQQKRKLLNAAFLFHRVLLCDESLPSLLCSLKATLSRTPVSLSFIYSVSTTLATNALPAFTSAIVYIRMCKLARLLKKIHQFSWASFYRSSNFRSRTQTHYIK